MENNENFENKKMKILKQYHFQLEQLEQLKKELVEAQKNNDTRFEFLEKIVFEGSRNY